MHYKQSATMRQEIEKASSILLNCHRNPDCDSIGSALAMARALEAKGKKTTIVCPSDIDQMFHFMKGADKIQTIDFGTFDFQTFDLLIFLDSASLGQITNDNNAKLPQIPTIIIDHHETNDIEGTVRLVDSKASSTAEIVLRILQDIELPVTPTMATALFAAVETDTVSFRYAVDPESTLRAAADLITAGADRDLFVGAIYNNYHIDVLRLLGKIFE